MKKFLRTLALMALLVVPGVVQAQSNLTVYEDETATNDYVPVYGFYCDAYLKAHFVYPADVLDELGTNATISQMTFYASQASVSWGNAEFNVYLAEVEDATISAFADVSNMTLVYTGSLSIAENEMVVEFVNNYTYNGGNLLVAIEQTVTGSYVTSTWYGATVSGSSVQGYNYSSLSGVAPTQRNFLPRVTFAYTSNGAATCTKPGAITVSNLTAHEATFTWGSTSANLYQVETKTAADTIWDEWTPQTDTTFTISNLNQNTAYNVRVKAICGTDFESAYRTASFTTQISCPAPTGLAATLTDGDGTVATLHWIETGSAETWEVCLNNDENSIYTVYDTTFIDLTGLTPEAIYTAKVRAYCDAIDQSSWSNSITFQPTMKTVIGSGTATNSYLPTNTYYNYSLTQQIYTAEEFGDASTILGVDFFCNQSRQRDITIYMVSTNKSSFEANNDWIPVTEDDIVFSDTVTFLANVWTTINFTNTFVYDGVENVAIIVDDNTGSYQSAPGFLAFDAPSQALRIYSDGTNYDPYNTSTYNGTILNVKNQIRLTTGAAASCTRPTNLTATEVTNNSVTLSWNDTENTGATYTVYNGEDVLATGLTATTYTVSNLDASTTYTFGVVANCTADDASIMASINVTTDCENGSCTISVVMNDSYGDGWNGNAIAVMQDSNILANCTILSGNNATQEVTVCSGSPIFFNWISGNYANETSFEIYDGASMLVYSGAGTQEENPFLVMENACPTCMPVNGLTAEATSNSITLSWTSDAASFDIYNDTVFVANVNTNSYTFTNLSANTTYTFGVVAVCDVDDLSAKATITATTECENGNCNVYVYAQDSWGDGWNGAAINVMQNGIVMGSYTMAGQGVSQTAIYDTAAISVCAGDAIDFSWSHGSYDTEITVGLANANEELLFEAAATTLTDTVFLSIENCNSLPVVDTVYEEVTACDQYVWYDTTYIESGVYTHETPLHVYILDLTVNYSSTQEETVTAENSYTWNGNVYTESGSYEVVTEGENGCPVTYILNLTITINDTTEPVACNTIVVTAANTFNEGFEAGQLSECWSNEGNSNWTVGTGDHYTSTGAHTGTYNAKITHSSTGNVTKLVTPVVDLTALTTPRLSFWYINRSWAGDVDALRVYYRTSEYDTTWTLAEEYTEGTTEWTMATVTLPTTAAQVAFEMTDSYGYGIGLDDVTIDETPICGDVIYTTQDVTACDSYVFNGVTYTESDTIVAMLTAANYCDSAEVTINLTINQSASSEVSVETDGDYMWNGNLFTVSGAYSFTTVAANGCDSVVTLHLTIVPPCTNTCQVTINGVDSYGDGWNGATISLIQSGNIIGSFGFYSGYSSTQTFDVCADYPIDFAWNSGSFDGEASFTIYNGAMELVYSFDSGINASVLPDSVFYTMYNAACPVIELYTITATSNDATLGSVYGGGIYSPGDSVVIIALPEVGSQFNGWNIAGSNPLTFVATSDMNIVANFSVGGAATHDTVTITLTDTVTVTETVTVHDTVTVTETVTVVDTVTVTETVTVTDTVTVTETVTDTITVTETVTDTITVTETVTDTLYITEYVHDTIIIHDTVYITPDGIDGIDAINAKVYVSEGQIVVEGAEGNNVVLYDISGRVLANKRDDFNALRFEAPASGSYLIRIGNHPARRIVVIK